MLNLETNPVVSPDKKRRSKRKPDTRRVSDEARFFRTWLRRPLVMGAVSPSSKALGRAMAGYVPDPTQFDESSMVLELGPGTGVVTQCLIERGVPESSLHLVEYSEEFCVLLRARFPKAKVTHGDAYQVAAEIESHADGRRLEAVISGLPLFTKPDQQREIVVGAPLARMAAGRPFIQFSYALTLPVKPARIGATIETSPWIKRNLPPARGLVYRKD